MARSAKRPRSRNSTSRFTLVEREPLALDSMTRVKNSLAVVLTIICLSALVCSADGEKPKTTPILLHERLSAACELVQSGQFLQYRDYSAVTVDGIPGELYSLELAPDLPWVEASLIEMQQVVLNLAVNALQAIAGAGAVALLAGLNAAGGTAGFLALLADARSAGLSFEQPAPREKSSRSRNNPLRTVTCFTVSRKNSF